MACTSRPPTCSDTSYSSVMSLFQIKILLFVKVALGKSAKLPFQAHSTHAPHFLHTIHTDVWGLASITFYDGFHFYRVIIDEFLGYIWLFLMALKSDVIYLFSWILN